MKDCHTSDSGKYKLVVESIETKPGCWNYTEGSIYRNDVLIRKVKRNYCSFPFLFSENHANGHDYLICGSDYQGQTVIELDTNKRKDFLPKEAKQGCGFCWADYTFDVASKILIVDGCVWACPYEFRFYDFSDPMSGWKELTIESEEGYIEDSDKKPEINGDIIKCFQTEKEYVESVEDESEEDYEKREEEAKKEIRSIITLKREGSKLIFQDEWISDKEKQRREDNEKGRKEYKIWLDNFKSTDPLYLNYVEAIKDFPTKEDCDSIGVTYKGWCPDFDKVEQRWCRRIVKQDNLTIDFEWAVKTGPIKLEIYKNKKSEDKFFEHSIKGMNDAFDLVKELMRQSK